MVRPFERVGAVLCYTGGIRVPILPLAVPDWVFTVPPGLVATAALWLYGRRRSAFVGHHARAGLVWTVQANGLLLLISLASRLSYRLWFQTGLPVLNALWHGCAEVYRWTGLLITLLTAIAMVKAAKGQTGDPLGLPH